MRVTLIGQAAFGEAVLERLVRDGHTIAGVSAPGPAGSRVDPLWAAADAADYPRIATGQLKEPALLASWRSFDADLCIMAFVTDILPDEVFGAARLGTIQYHPSLLPLHRGASAMNWAIINGDAETGLTIFWPDEGIDTGPILLQERCGIGPEDTVATLYFEQLFPMGVDAMARAVQLVAEGKAEKREQDHRLSTYEPPCTDRHAEIRWHEPAQRVFALIRGCNPQPGAWTLYQGRKLRIFDCHLLGEPAPGREGRVLRVGGDGFDVRLNGDVLHVVRVQDEGQKKTPAGEWAARAGLEVGYRFRF
jgi:methionyl-tRNA formyltransferase